MQFALPGKTKEQYKDKSPGALEKAVSDTFYAGENSIDEKIIATKRMALENIDVYANNREISEAPFFKKLYSHRGLYIVEKSPTSILDSQRENYDVFMRDVHGRKVHLLQDNDTDIFVVAEFGRYEGTTYVRDENKHIAQADTERHIAIQQPGLLIPWEYKEDLKETQGELREKEKQKIKKSNSVSVLAGTAAFTASALTLGPLAAVPIGIGAGYLGRKAVSRRETRFDVSKTHPTLFGKQEVNPNYQDHPSHQ